LKAIIQHTAIALGAGALALAAVALVPSEARACGGFFCAQVPVDQMGEEIIFGINPGGTVTAQILINYTGEAEDFSWILPLPSVPEISLGSMRAFQVVRQSTQPQFWLEWDGSNECGGWWWMADASMEGDPSPPSGGGVNVLAEKEVGPFDTVVLESASTDDLLAWLAANGYDQPPEARALLDHYVRQEMVFVALKLRKDESVGSIQPITLELVEQDPCVPLVLTQIAAVPDMPVRLYIASEHRVVPTNWMHVVLNLKKIDWLNWGANYNDVVIQATNEAAGHGFVTEYAGTSEIMERRFYRPERFDLDLLRGISDPVLYVESLFMQDFPRDTSTLNILRRHIPMPASLAEQGVSEQAFYNDIRHFADHIDGLDFDPVAATADFDERIVTPLRETQALFDARPYLTRLYTTVSPEDMTRDPIFAQNPDLPDVSNQHTATAVGHCDPDNEEVIERITITLPDGESYDLPGPFDRWCPGCGGPVDPAPHEPAAKRIELIGRTGAPVLLDPSQVEEVDRQLDTKSPEQVLDELGSGVIVQPPVAPRTGGSSGCASSAPALPVALALAALLGLAVVRRRVGARR